MIRKNPNGDMPQVHRSAFIDPAAIVIGKVEIGKNVFVAPGAVIRADEENSSVIINENCNVQDRVVIHSLAKSSVVVGKNTSLSHGCIIHGPCKIGKNCFIGFGSVVFQAKIEDGVFINLMACVSSVTVKSKRMVQIGEIIDLQYKSDMLKPVIGDCMHFGKQVLKVNLHLLKGYRKDKP